MDQASASRPSVHESRFVLKLPRGELILGGRPRLMGIVNVTPDSFSDGGQCNDPVRAAEHALRLVDQGADVLDVGGESTRPGALGVSVEEELGRVMPVVERIVSRTDVPVSIDTAKSAVAREALAAGAAIVNDVTGLRGDPAMSGLVAEHGVPVVCMHMLGTPRTMQQDPRYDDVVAELADFFQERLAHLCRAGIDRSQIILDPGIGFGKTLSHNLEILRNIERLSELGQPVCVGHSRKSFIGMATGQPVGNRLIGSVAVAVGLCYHRVHVLRVHDVEAVRQAVDLVYAMETGDLPAKRCSGS